MKRSCEVIIDDNPFCFDIEGDFSNGKEECLYPEKDNIISKAKWEDKGYSVENVLSEDGFCQLKKIITDRVGKAILDIIPNFDINTFRLEDYHKTITNNTLHNKVINITRDFVEEDFGQIIELIVSRAQEIVRKNLTTLIPEMNRSHVVVRISRPNSLDINPAHRDGYLSYYEKVLNMWLPIAGCNINSTLPVLEGSHKSLESDLLKSSNRRAVINNNTYTVPGIVKYKNENLKMNRPPVHYGEAIVFTPFLIHGVAINQNDDVTRVSLELRLTESF